MSEQVYLKCVETDVDYLTVGKVYVADVDPTGGYNFTVDTGEHGYQWKLCGGHGDFEIVPEPAQEQPKLTPRSLGCFQEVADVIGEENAEVELQKVIDSEDTVWDEPDQDLIQSFIWGTSPQGDDFWRSVFNGQVPEELQTKAQPKSTPALGDVLHYNGEQVVYLSNLHSGCHLVSFENGVALEVTLDELDEYKPNETQELRNRILERWQRKSLDNSHDTEVCIAEMRVSDLIDFVVDNLNAEYSGE